MKLNHSLIRELELILEEEYSIKLRGKDLNRFANGLVGYFDLLEKINRKEDVRK